MEALLSPVYDYYAENVYYFDTKGHLSVPADYTPVDDGYGGYQLLEISYADSWILEGSAQVFYDNNGDVRMVRIELDGGMDKIYIMAQAVYASCVEGMTPDLGKKIADALHLDNAGFVMPEGKYSRMLFYEGYNYYAYKGPSSGPYYRLWVWPTDDYDWSKEIEAIIFDIDGNQV